MVTRSEQSFDPCFTAHVPALLVWAELHLPSSARDVIAPEDLVVEVWRQARTRWPASVVALRPWLLELARDVFAEMTHIIKRELLFRGGCPEDLRAVHLLELPTKGLALVRNTQDSPLIRNLLDQVAHLDPDDRRVLLYRGIEGLDDQSAAELARLTVGELRSRWRELSSRFAAWQDLFSVPPELEEQARS